MLLMVSSQDSEQAQTNLWEVLQQGGLHGQLVQISVQQRMDAFCSRCISASILRHCGTVSLAIVVR
jgi:hypothetical protein